MSNLFSSWRIYDPNIWSTLGSLGIPLAEICTYPVKSSLRYKELFKDIETYCMFIGYPRSGHTVIGSLLDAHPNVIIGHEVDVLKYIKAGLTMNQIFYLLLKNSIAFTKSGRKWNGYSYYVPHQWQGKFQQLKVIGDKKAGRSSKRLNKNPELLNKLYATVDVKNIKFIHIIRNPYDNICTLAKKHYKNDLRISIEDYFSMCNTVTRLKKQIEPNDIIEIKFELFLKNPENWLKKLCFFLGMNAPDDYLNDCCRILYKLPHKSRYDLTWDSELIKLVNNKIDEFDYLIGYSYDE